MLLDLEMPEIDEELSARPPPAPREEPSSGAVSSISVSASSANPAKRRKSSHSPFRERPKRIQERSFVLGDAGEDSLDDCAARLSGSGRRRNSLRRDAGGAAARKRRQSFRLEKSFSNSSSEKRREGR
jgi:hypothetical protein